MSEFVPVAAELTLQLEGSGVGAIANNLTTTVEGYALDARQGYALDQKKLDTAKVANNLVTTSEGWALDARQGKYLADTKMNYTDIVNNLTTDNISKPLSAAQGKKLQDEKVAIANVANDLTTTAAGKVLDARQGKVLSDRIANSKMAATRTLTIAGWSSTAPYTQTIDSAGVTADGIVIVTPAPQSYEKYSENIVYCSAQTAGKLTFTAVYKPTVQLKVNVLLLN